MREDDTRRMKYRFAGRVGNRYIWESVYHLPQDSRIEEITCDVDWFWRGGRR